MTLSIMNCDQLSSISVNLHEHLIEHRERTWKHHQPSWCHKRWQWFEMIWIWFTVSSEGSFLRIQGPKINSLALVHFVDVWYIFLSGARLVKSAQGKHGQTTVLFAYEAGKWVLSFDTSEHLSAIVLCYNIFAIASWCFTRARWPTLTTWAAGTGSVCPGLKNSMSSTRACP